MAAPEFHERPTRQKDSRIDSRAARSAEEGSVADTIAVLNMKGGVGKTTLAVNLASYCFDPGRAGVLLVDLDPQFNASQYLMDYKTYEAHLSAGGTIADLLIDSPTLTLRRRPKKKTIDDCVYRIRARQGPRKYFDLLPSQLALSHVVKNPAQMEYRLERLLQPIQSRYDYIFIDCAPTDSVLTTMALMASGFLLIPVRPDRFSILGYALVGETVRQFRDNSPNPHNIQELGTVFTQVNDATGIEGQCMAEIRRLATQDGSYVFSASLPVSRTFLRAVQNQTPAFETKYARTELKGSISDIVREMKTRIAAQKKTIADEQEKGSAT
jgi:chromosome partitioning protein